MNRKIILIVLILAIIVGGLAILQRLKTETNGLSSSATTELPQDENGGFVLYVSNQSFDIDPVDIKILIDGKSAVAQDFYIKGQHNWQKFQFSLPKGNHKISVTSTKGAARLEEEFEIEDKHWAVVDYWYYPDKPARGSPTPKHFSFHFRNRPIRFK